MKYLFLLLLSLPHLAHSQIPSTLTGTWQSTNDMYSYIIFTEKYQKNIQDGNILDSSLYHLTTDSTGTKLIVENGRRDKEYKILSLTDNSLSLSYLPRGKKLNYKKVDVMYGKRRVRVDKGNRY